MAMKRFIFNIFSLLSAASFTAIAALWIISCFRADEVHLARVEQALQWWDAKGLVIVSSAGRVGLLAFHMRVPLLPHTLKYPNPPDFEHVSAAPLRDFYFSINPATERHGLGFQIGKASGKRFVVIPLWFVMIVSLVLPALRLRRWGYKKRQHLAPINGFEIAPMPE